MFVPQEDVSAATLLRSWTTLMAQFEMWSAHSAILYPSGSASPRAPATSHDLSSPAWPSPKNTLPTSLAARIKPDASAARPRSGP